MDFVASLPSRQVEDIVLPTHRKFAELQIARKEEIFKHPFTSHSFGPHPRHNLNLFIPSKATDKKLPVVLFLYGGGLVRGDRVLENTKETIYTNLAAFLVERGFVAVLPDYRRVNEEEKAKFPSGGEDIGLAVDWVVKNVKEVDPEKVFLWGASGGGVHCATYLWTSNAQFLSSVPRHPIRGLVTIGAPLDFAPTPSHRLPVLDQYYGEGLRPRSELCPRGLRAKSKNTTPMLLVEAEFDPEEILETRQAFFDCWGKGGGLEGSEVPLPEVLLAKGHNHISMPVALGLGAKEDRWGEDAVDWMKTLL